MLADNNGAYCEKVQVILGFLRENHGPGNERLNQLLVELSSSEILCDLFADAQFTMTPILKELVAYLASDDLLQLSSVLAFSGLLQTLAGKLDQIESTGQKLYISSLIEFLHRYNEEYLGRLENQEDKASFNRAFVKVDESFKMTFRTCLERLGKENLKHFALESGKMGTEHAGFIWRNFAKYVGKSDHFNDLQWIFLKKNVEFVKKLSLNFQIDRSKAVVNAITCILLISRYFSRNPQLPETPEAIGCLLEVAAVFGKSPFAEVSEKAARGLNDSLRFLSENPQIVEILVERDLFHGFDLMFLREARQENLSSAPMLNCVKRILLTHVKSGEVGPLLALNADSRSLFDLFLKVFPIEDVSPAIDLISDSSPSAISLELVARLLSFKAASFGGISSFVDKLLNVCAEREFSTDAWRLSHAYSVLRLSLLSCPSDGLGELFKARMSRLPRSFSVSNLVLISSFPFSLWRSLERTELVQECVKELLFQWKSLIEGSAVDVLFLVLGALASFLQEVPDLLKTEHYKQIFSLLPSTIISLRTNEGFGSIPRLKLAVALQKLLKGLLLLRDDKIFDVLDAVIRVGSLDSGKLASIESWNAVALFPFAKHSRDSERLNKSVSERFDMLVPKLLSLSDVEFKSPASSLLYLHHARHVLYKFTKYSHDVNVFQRDFLQQGKVSEGLTLYLQGYAEAWPKGNFDATAEEGIWRFIDSGIRKPRIKSRVISLKGPIPSMNSCSPSSLQNDLLSLQKIILNLSEVGNQSSLLSLHEGLQQIMKKFQ